MKKLFVSKNATANRSSEINAKKRSDNGTKCETTKLSERRRTLNRQSIKKVFFAIGTFSVAYESPFFWIKFIS
jgi:hypothetical protein